MPSIPPALSRAAALALSLATVPAASAQSFPIPAPAKSAAPVATESAAPVPDQSDAREDVRLATRIRSIFSEIPDLRAVKVRVAAGVVTLTGKVPSDGAKTQAEAIAGKVSGVVTVQDQIERDLAVSGNLNPALGGITARARSIVSALPLIGVALLIGALVIAFGYWFARQKKLWHRVAPNPFLAELVASAIRFVFIIAAIVLALDIIGATALLGAVLGGAGVIGIAIGFAVRDTIDNYISSLMLSVRQPFRARDRVKVDDLEGTVMRLTSRATILMTPDGNHLRVPNSTVFKATIVNFTTNPKRRFQFELIVDQHADTCEALAKGLEALRSLDFVLDDPEPRSEIAEIPGTTQVLRFFGWIDQRRSDFNKARTRAFQEVHQALSEDGLAVSDTRYVVELEQSAPSAPQPPAGPPPAPRQTAPNEDVSPDEPVKEMVAEERAGDDDKDDLLDHSRPTE